MKTPQSAFPNSVTIARAELPNGITVLVYENFAAQSVVISGSLGTGSLFEPPLQNGLAAFTASALLRGTRVRSFDHLATTLEDIGADLDVGSGVHRTGFGGKALAEDLPILIELLGDVLREPAFPEDQVERLRGEIMTGLQIRSQDTRFRASRAFYEALYPAAHPYHYSGRGSLETIPTLTTEDLRRFHSETYTPDGMIIAIVGAVRSEEAIEYVRSHLGDWQNLHHAAPPELPPLEPRQQPARVFVPLPGKTQTDLIIGGAGPSRLSDDYLPAMLVNSVLGQFGMMGRIGAIVREELGLAYYAYSSLDGGMGPTPWRVTAGVSPGNVERAVDEILRQIRRITTEPVSDEDLASVQSYFIGRLPLQLESNEGIAGSILSMELYDLGFDYLDTFPEKLRALTVEDLLKAAQHYLKPDAYVLGLSGPE